MRSEEEIVQLLSDLSLIRATRKEEECRFGPPTPVEQQSNQILSGLHMVLSWLFFMDDPDGNCRELIAMIQKEAKRIRKVMGDIAEKN